MMFKGVWELAGALSKVAVLLWNTINNKKYIKQPSSNTSVHKTSQSLMEPPPSGPGYVTDCTEYSSSPVARHPFLESYLKNQTGKTGALTVHEGGLCPAVLSLLPCPVCGWGWGWGDGSVGHRGFQARAGPLGGERRRGVLGWTCLLMLVPNGTALAGFLRTLGLMFCSCKKGPWTGPGLRGVVSHSATCAWRAAPPITYSS